MNTKHLLGILTIFTFGLLACKSDPKPTSPAVKKDPVKIPAANGDSLFTYVEKQLSFGYRIPGTPEHVACKDWIVSKLKSYGAEVVEQKFKASFLTVKDVDAYNIIATFNPGHKKRILLGAHWDSRMIAEKDKDQSKRNQPIYGADDGGSGVAGLLEIARQLNENEIDIGIDLIFFDAEDQGNSNADETDTWALGAQHWSKNLHKRGYKAKFGILLDMIGSKGATFGKEYYSQQYAKMYQDKVWTLARRMGYTDMFINTAFGQIGDDHLYVNMNAGIPMFDIINYRVNENLFGAYHHTHDDDIDVIDKRTLRVVTQVVLAAIFKESEGSL